MKLSQTQMDCLAWFADDSQEFGCPGGRRTLRALSARGLANLNDYAGRWEITDAGRMELGPVELTAGGNIASL